MITHETLYAIQFIDFLWCHINRCGEIWMNQKGWIGKKKIGSLAELDKMDPFDVNNLINSLYLRGMLSRNVEYVEPLNVQILITIS